MFDYVNENKRVVQVILLLLVLPFALWGVNSYRQSGSDVVATVEGEKISQKEFDDALRNAEETVRQQRGGAVDPAEFERPEFRQLVLDELIDAKLIVVKARAAGLAPSEAQLMRAIEESFQKDGKFDGRQYEAWLRGRGMTAQAAEKGWKDTIASRHLSDMYLQNGYASSSAAENLVRIGDQQRVMSVARIAPEEFLSQAKVDEAEAKKYYEDNQPEFSIPERVRVEYVMFSAATLMQQMTASAEEVQAYYKEHEAEFTIPEQRRASHILIPFTGNGDEADIKATREQAAAILKQVKQSPGKFAELAKKYSKDPASAAKGGDLGFFGRGRMVKPFEEAAFSLKPGEISDLVQSPYGFHIIKLAEVRAQKTASLEEVKGVIVQKIKMSKAGNEFATMIDKFNDAAASQNGSLKDASDLVKSPVQQSGWLEKGRPGMPPWTEKALVAVFSDDVLNKKRNSGAIEVAPDTQIAVRLLEHQPAAVRPFTEVSAAITKKLALKKANEMANKRGQEVLAQLQRGEKPSLKWGSAQAMSLAHPVPGTDSRLVYQAFRADTGKLPVYVGVDAGMGGYVLARVESVKEAVTVEELKRESYKQTLRDATGRELLRASLADARKHASINTKGSVAASK
jgi:peptidyl-prolyl cis-trans isomerase D